VVVEKPFGSDLASARRLNADLTRHTHESQLFRIDHYLGKETVQNLLMFRFSNAIFERLWHREAIEHVQITVSEQHGVGARGGYYEEAGALRDMVQNHLLQVLALVAMEPPVSLEAESIRDEKVKLLKALRVWQPEQVADQSSAANTPPARSAARRAAPTATEPRWPPIPRWRPTSPPAS
jgi:glucose-6-phosphate 1-dehydrogenase